LSSHNSYSKNFDEALLQGQPLWKGRLARIFVTIGPGSIAAEHILFHQGMLLNALGIPRTNTWTITFWALEM
jgi:hypothetical protein